VTAAPGPGAALAPGTSAPDFALRDQNNQRVRLADVRRGRDVLLVFYPFAFTGVCRGELAGIQEDLGSFGNDAVQVLTISVDSVFAHKVWAEREGYEFPLLADFWPHGAVASAYGVFDASRGVAERATFVVDRAGVIRFAEVNPPGVARDLGRWRAALAALRG
jgi:peroxiredoxin (alkyl hydroperoxide reductase subunit C)